MDRQGLEPFGPKGNGGRRQASPLWGFCGRDERWYLTVGVRKASQITHLGNLLMRGEPCRCEVRG